jgi:hypothetical protein
LTKNEGHDVRLDFSNAFNQPFKFSGRYFPKTLLATQSFEKYPLGIDGTILVQWPDDEWD